MADDKVSGIGGGALGKLTEELLASSPVTCELLVHMDPTRDESPAQHLPSMNLLQLAILEQILHRLKKIEETVRSNG